MSKETSEPAFPRNDDAPGHNGMDLRDYFAAKALPGLMGRDWSHHNGTDAELIKVWAASSYAMADAMLLERAK